MKTTMRVLLIGLKKEQSDRIRAMFKSSVDLQVMDAQAKHSSKIGNSTNFDYIVVCTKFTNHSTHAHYRGHPGYVMTTGAKSAVVALLNSFTGEGLCQAR